ncbi:apoptosis-associated speck-like protein containing a CARD [Mantella aurantiaca]
MEEIVWNSLHDILEDLDERQFKSFCSSLCDPHEGYSKIPGSSLENVNHKDVVDLIQRTFSYPQGIELAATILYGIDERDMAENLNGYLNYVIQGMVKFINHHSADLIIEVTVVDPILDDLLQQKLLTQEQYHEIHSNPTSEMKMWELYMYVNDWSDRNQAILYGLLKKHNDQLITSLYLQDKEQRSKLPPPLLHKVDCINHHSEDLIRQVTVVDPILDDLLQQKLLTQTQDHEIRRNHTSKMKMRELYTYVNAWSNRDKAILYGLLKKYNKQLIRSLRDQDKEPRPILPPREL